MLRALDEIVDSSLSEKIRLGFLARTNLAIGGALVHPVDSIYSFLSTCGFKLPLQLFLCALLLDFVDSLLGALALGECLLLFIPDGLLISPQGGMEGLLEVEIAATHDGYVFRAAVLSMGSVRWVEVKKDVPEQVFLYELVKRARERCRCCNCCALGT